MFHKLNRLKCHILPLCLILGSCEPKVSKTGLLIELLNEGLEALKHDLHLSLIYPSP